MRPTQTPPPTQAPTPTRTSSLLLPSPISPRLKVVCSNGTHCPNATADNSSITLSSAPAPTPTPIQHIHRATTGSDSNWKRTVVIAAIVKATFVEALRQEGLVAEFCLQHWVLPNYVKDMGT
ncbi:hypothetical protein MTR_6g083190 [Medicago truncatula]|uniref:Uncharacterized protein n=1 Tax=Medicago truncatula TaxID=3880 RepID=A0A072UB48_MEDTR|nr:hypothetical protein MTR_6g083190 [Medicago truncatula]